MPDYKTHDPRGWCGDPSRGAALGRPTVADGEPEGKMTLRRVRMSADGAYDSNGTYFGCGEPLYWYADEGGNVDAVLRARSREDAKRQVREIYPTAKFYR
jgi:hypothetical protein